MNHQLIKADGLPLIFAHRGANSFAPENSLDAFEKAIDLGCDGIEMDLRYTASGDIIIFHDRTLNRMSSQKGNVHQLSLAAIKKACLDGQEKCQIPTFQEALDLIRDRVRIILDVKRETIRSNGFEEKIVSILKDFNLRDSIIISSFNPLVLKKIAKIAPDFHLGFILSNRSHRLMTIGTSLKSLHVMHTILTKKYLESIQAKGYRVYPWTVDSEDGMRHFTKMGVDGIITNRPEIFFRMVERDKKVASAG